VADKYGITTTRDLKRIVAVTRRVEGSPRTYLHVPEQISRRFGGGGDCSCLTVHEIATSGLVSGGTFDLDVEIREEDGTLTAETLSSIDWDATAFDVLTAYLTHSKINSGDVGVRGGPLPDAPVYVVFKTAGDLNRHQEVPVPDSSNLTGGGVVKTAQVTSADWEQGL
jgi:hypothetical protein